jgi:hypothetical protein
MGRHHRNGPTTIRHQLLRKMDQIKATICRTLNFPTIDPTFRKRVYQIIEFAAVPINVSPPTLLYTLDVALLAQCPFHSVGFRTRVIQGQPSSARMANSLVSYMEAHTQRGI